MRRLRSLLLVLVSAVAVSPPAGAAGKAAGVGAALARVPDAVAAKLAAAQLERCLGTAVVAGLTSQFACQAAAEQSTSCTLGLVSSLCQAQFPTGCETAPAPCDSLGLDPLAVVNSKLVYTSQQLLVALTDADHDGYVDESITLQSDLDVSALGLPVVSLPAGESFDGRGHTLKGLRQALFYWETRGSVRRVTLEGVVIGALLTLHNYGLVEQVVARGAVTADASLGYLAFVGGLVGHNDGEVAGCSSSASVDATGAQAGGGLVGYQSPLGALSGCSVSGRVSGAGNVGGLLGMNDLDWGTGSSGAVLDCSSTATVSGRDNVGGLVGWNSGLVDHCTAAAVVHATGNTIGGLVGHNFYGTIASSTATGPVSASSTLAWSDDWGDYRGSVSGVGGLAGRSHGGFIEASACSGAVDVTGVADKIGGLLGWSIGARVTGNVASSNVRAADSNAVGGLVGSNGGDGTNGGWLTNNRASGTVRGLSRVGGLVGYIYVAGASGSGIEMDRCSASGDVTGDSMVGGLIGSNDGQTLLGCYASGSVRGSVYVGGLMGVIYSEVVFTYALLRDGNGVVYTNYTGAINGSQNSYADLGPGTSASYDGGGTWIPIAREFPYANPP